MNTTVGITYDPGLIAQALKLIWESEYRITRALSLVKNNRVIQCSPTRFMVESRKYPNKPSKMYIIQARNSGHSKPYDLWCNCFYAGYCPDPFNVCSHILACYLATTLKDGSLSLLAMRDDARRKEQEEKAAVPIVGNEYPDHTKQKKRVHDLLLKDYWWGVQYEREVHCVNPISGQKNRNPYSLDVFGFREYAGGHLISVGIEINREETGGGHGSKITIPKDRNRAQDIWDQHRIKVIAFNVSHLKAATDEMILEEIYQKIGV